MEFCIDGQKIDGVTNIETIKVNEEETYFPTSFSGEGTFTIKNVKSNIRLMSPEMRKHFKQIKYNGKIYW